MDGLYVQFLLLRVQIGSVSKSVHSRITGKMIEDDVPIDHPDYPGGRTVNVAAQFTLCSTAKTMKVVNSKGKMVTPPGGAKKFLNMQKIGLMKDMGFGSNPKRFTASLCRIRVYPPHFGNTTSVSPQDVTALVYHTGNVVLTGASNVKMANLAAWNLTWYFADNGIPVQMRTFKVENIVAKFHTGFYVDLDAFAQDRGLLVEYEPEKFPAAIYKGLRDDGKEYKILVYKTGSLVITGLRTRDEAAQRYIALCDKLTEYKLEFPFAKEVYRSNTDVESVGRALQIMTRSFADAMQVQPPLPIDKIIDAPLNSIRQLYEPRSSIPPEPSYIVRMPQGNLEWSNENIVYRPTATYVPVQGGKKRVRVGLLGCNYDDPGPNDEID